MNGSGANEDDMRFLTRVSEQEVDDILAGHAIGEESADVASFFREMRIGLDEAPTTSVESRHLGRIFEEARNVQSSAPQRKLAALRRTRRPSRWLATRTTAAAVGLAALAAFGGAAYAGSLPAPVQGKVADLARNVGLSLPGNHERSKQHGGHSHTSIPSPGNAGQPGQDNGARRNGHGNNTRGADTQGSGDQGTGDQGTAKGDGTQINSGPDNSTQDGAGGGDQGATTSDNQGDQPSTVQSGQSQPGSKGAQNEQSTPSGETGADGGQGTGDQGTAKGDGTQINSGPDNSTQDGAGCGDQGATTSNNQSDQPSTVQSGQSQPGSEGAQNEQSTPSSETGADGGQQGQGTANGS